MIFVYTGNGKGKTTAAIGQAIRAIGYGRKVLMIQFVKSPKWPSGEEKTAKKLKPFFEIEKFGLGFVLRIFAYGDGGFRPVAGKNPKLKFAHQGAAEKGWEYAKREIKSGRWDLVILDEINVAAKLGLLKAKQIIDFLKNKRNRCLNNPWPLIILTGRNAPKSFIKIADLVTEMKEVKHPYKKGIIASKGLEY